MPSWKVTMDRKTNLPVSRVNFRTQDQEDNENYYFLPSTHKFVGVMQVQYIGDVVVSLTDLTTGCGFSVGHEDFFKMLQQTVVYNGLVVGVWGFRKVSEKYRIYFVEGVPCHQ